MDELLKELIKKEALNFLKHSEKYILDAAKEKKISLDKAVSLLSRLNKKKKSRKGAIIVISILTSIVVLFIAKIIIDNYDEIKKKKRVEDKLMVILKKVDLKKIKKHPIVKMIKKYLEQTL